MSLPSFGMGQDFAFGLAERLLNIREYDEAITEYKRFICFATNSNDEMVSDAWFQIGIAYRNQAQWENALNAFHKSLSITTNNKLKDERRIDIGVLLIAKQDYSKAEFELLRVSMFSHYPPLRRKATFFLGICYLYTFKWKEAQKAFNQYFDDSQILQREQVDSLLAVTNYPKYKFPKIAKWLSTFIPGLGQIYGGDLKDGLNAMAINIGTGYLLTNSLLEHRYEDAFISYLFLFQRYYSGNRYNAERITKEYNEKLGGEYSGKVLSLISKETRRAGD
jgi:tetratricopeptide (TPR) repeat protein